MLDNQIEQYFKNKGIDLSDIISLKNLMQRNNDLLQGGLRSNNVTSFRTIDTYNTQDSLDATYPMYLHLAVSDDMAKIVSIKLSFWILPFRAYDTTSANSSALTSGATGAPSGGGSTSGSGGAQTSSSGGSQTSSSASKSAYVVTTYPTTSVTNVGDEGSSGLLITGAFTQAQCATNDHTHTVANHTHTVVDHTHTTPAHTHPEHTHSVPAHNHAITFGIYEEDNSPTIGVSISRDNGETYGNVLGQYTEDVSNLEIKEYITTAGSYIVRFTSSARARVSAQITMKLDIVAR